MANALYTKYLTRILGSGTASLIDWDTDTIKVVLVDSGVYTPNLTTNQFLTDIASVVATATLGSVTITGKVVDANDATFTAVSGAQSEYVIGYKDTGSGATSPLGFYFDTFSSGMPVTPNGGDIVVVWNASGIFTF